VDPVSRAFIDEDSEVLLNRESIVHEKKLRDWLAIQEKKLVFLRTDKRAEEMDQTLREDWIREIVEDIERTRRRIDELPSPGADFAGSGDIA